MNTRRKCKHIMIKRNTLLYINLTTLLDNQRQLIQYLNKKVYQSGQPMDSGDMLLYEQKQMTMKQVYSETVLMTDLLNEKTARSFSTWCGTAKLDLTLADQTHKMQKTDDSKTKIRYRFLWVLKGIIHRGILC